jgi:hypothetical protein
MLVQQLAGAAHIIQSSPLLLKKSPQIVSGQVKGRFLLKEDLHTILHFGGVTVAHFGAAW